MPERKFDGLFPIKATEHKLSATRATEQKLSSKIPIKIK